MLENPPAPTAKLIAAARADHEERIGTKHDSEAFDCSEEALNEFLRRYARKAMSWAVPKTFLAIDDADNKTMLGFYSLSPASVDYARKTLPVGRR